MKRVDLEGKQMLLTMKTLFDKTPDFALLRPAFVPVMNSLTEILKQIIGAQTAQGIETSGDATNKDLKFTDLAKKLFKITSAASAYASTPAVKDAVLKAKVKYTVAQLLDVNYGEIEAVANNIIAAVTPVQDLLADFGVDATDVTAASDALSAFIKVQSAPATDRADKKVQTANIHPFVVAGKALLTEQGDEIANTLLDAKNDLYKTWYSGRNIVHLPHGTTIAEGFVYSADGVTPIYDAKVDFAPQNISVQTFLDGSFSYPHFPHGVTTPTATVPKFVVNTLAPAEIKQGKSVKFNFTMVAL